VKIKVLHVSSLFFRREDGDGKTTNRYVTRRGFAQGSLPVLRTLLVVDVSYTTLQADGIVNVALHWEYSPGIVFIFSLGWKDLYHV
jgi:hypothetical protein